jgi:epoxyqueuosine reductase
MRSIPFETLRALAAQVGLSVIAVTDADALTADGERLTAWQSAGYAATMGYMERPSDLLAVPKRLLESALSIVVVAVHYDRIPRPALPEGHGRIARYAWGRDYHEVLRTRLSQFVELVSEQCRGGVVSRVFSDSVPLLERALSAKAGISFIGKNTMAIIPGQGSFFFIGEVVWDIAVEGVPTSTGTKRHCGTCSQCLSGCPTNALVSERTLDAGRCISYLTIEKRGVLTYQERHWLGEWLFGCDVCQDVCPFNVVSLKKKREAMLPELSAGSGVGPSLSLRRVISMRTDEAFRDVFKGTAIVRTKREGLVRNATIVAANTHVTDLFDLLVESAEQDPSGVVRRHALWAAAVIADREGGAGVRTVKNVIDRVAQGSDDALRDEVHGLSSQLPNLV